MAVTEARASDIDVDVVSVGITNQRETIVAWDRTTGVPLADAIVWHDTRTREIVDEFISKCGGDSNALRGKTGLPINTYFSAVKIVWLLRNAPRVAYAAENDRVCFGTIDSWLTWKLTGGQSNPNTPFVTDVTNASRTLLMDLKTGDWSDELLSLFSIPRSSLPKIISSSEVIAPIDLMSVAISTLPKLNSLDMSTFKPLISGLIGDQQAACVGQLLFEPGQAKCTFGTGAFVLFNTGTDIIESTSGLLTTPCYKLGKDAPITYALEGSIGTAGSGITWLVESGLLSHPGQSSEHLADFDAKMESLLSESEASELEDRIPVFVPAFSGLFAPRWRPDAKGALLGLTQGTTRAHITVALMRGIVAQLKEVLDCMSSDFSKFGMQSSAGFEEGSLKKMKVDGGMSTNSHFLQLCADMIGSTVERPDNPEVTSLGAAIAAGLGSGFWTSIDHVKETKLASISDSWSPKKNLAWRKKQMKRWESAVKKAVEDV